MTSNAFRFDVPADELPAFVCALALGTLEAMRAGSWSLDAGIWSLSAPAFHRPLRDVLPEPLATIFDAADELSALAKLGGADAARARLEELIAALRRLLPQLIVRAWSARVTRE